MSLQREMREKIITCSFRVGLNLDLHETQLQISFSVGLMSVLFSVIFERHLSNKHSYFPKNVSDKNIFAKTRASQEEGRRADFVEGLMKKL